MQQTRERVTVLVQDMLKNRGLHRPDGRSLWQYGVTEDERTELEEALRAFCEVRAGTSLFYFTDESRSSHIEAAFGLHTALWYQRSYVSGNLSYHMPLSELRESLDPSQARRLGQSFSGRALGYWSVPREHRQHQDLMTLISQGGVQFARLARANRSEGGGWGTLAPLKSVIAQLASDDLKLSDSFELLNIQKDGLPNYYQSKPAIECISTLIQWFWRATNRVDALDSAPSADDYTRSLQDTQSEVENARYFAINADLLAIYKLAFTEIATAQVRQKKRYHCDILLEPQSARQQEQAWGIKLNVRAPQSLSPELSDSLVDHEQRAFLVLDMGSSHYQVAHYYRPYEGEFERDGYVQNTPSAALQELALGAQFSVSGRPVFKVPPVPLHVPLIFEESPRGHRYVGSYGTSLKNSACILLMPTALGHVSESPDYKIENCGSLKESTDIEYHVFRLTLPAQDAGEYEAKPVDILLPSELGDTDRSYITLRAPNTYSSFLIPDEPSSSRLDFGLPTVRKTTAFRLGNTSFDEEVSREYRTLSVDYFPHGQSTRVPSPPYGRNRVRPISGGAHVEPLKVVVVPDKLRLTAEFGAGEIKIRVSPPVGAVSIQHYGDPDTSYRFENGELWTVPSSQRLSHIPRLRITFEDWKGQPTAAFRPLAQTHSGFIARREDGLQALTNRANHHQAQSSLAELSSVLFTADPRARRNGKGLTLRAELRRSEETSTTQFIQRYWTFNAPNSQRGPLFQLGDIVEELRAMFRVQPHVDDTIHLSVVVNGTEHTLKVRRDFGSLERATVLEHDIIRAAKQLNHPILQRNLYAPARLVLLEEPSVVYADIRFDDELNGWRVPEGLVPGTYLFLTSRELYRPFLLPNGTYEGESDWAQAAAHTTVPERKIAFETLFLRYTAGETDGSVKTAIDTLLEYTRSAEPTSFEGLIRLMQQPKALLHYLHVDHPADKDQFERTLQSFESIGARWWTIPGYHWFEASLAAPNQLNVFVLWPLIAQRSPLLARSLIRVMFNEGFDRAALLFERLNPFTAQALKEDDAYAALQNHLYNLPDFEGSWSAPLVNRTIENRSFENNSHLSAASDAPQAPTGLRQTSVASQSAWSNGKRKDATLAQEYSDNAPMERLYAPTTEEIRKALVDASQFVVTQYLNDEIISSYAMSTLLPLRWIAPNQFDLLCAIRLA